MKRYVLFLLIPATCFSQMKQLDSCLYVSSYHKGYEWNDGIEKGIQDVLDGKCSLSKFYMDTKRNKSLEQIKQAALSAKEYIMKNDPDIVIACDDNAAKYLIKPYFRDAEKPFVFCGINWTVEPYGLPYSNTTGIVEISPIKPLIKEIKTVLKSTSKAIYIGPDVISQHKEYALNKKLYKNEGIELTPIFVKTLQQWQQAFIDAQSADFIIIGNNGGIDDWNKQQAINHVSQHAKVLTVTNYEWMTSYAMLAMTKMAEEQGEWAAKVSLAILGGEKPKNIPIIANRKWHIYINPFLLDKTNIKLTPDLEHKAKKVAD